MPKDHGLEREASDLADATILVTGGAGFVGSHLVDALAPVADVRVLDDCSTGRAANVDEDAVLLEGDVTDPAQLSAAVADVDVVFHLAALSAVPDTMAEPTRCLQVNASATGAILEHARRVDARVVFASSAAVYGRPDETPISEDDSLTPRNPYGVAKLASDQYVRRYEQWFDVPAVALRFFNVYGPRQLPDRGVIPTFLSNARAGEPLVVEGDGEQTRDFVHVSDVVRALLAAATTDATGEAFNVGTGEATSIAELAELIRDLSDDSVPVHHDDPRPADIEHSVADVSKARDRLGFDADVSLAAGLESLLARQVEPT
ncbi:NAD-dependent epimerase/dehydratase family protein [Haloarchaeobius sp. HRN-SO-5]|uniref:NAD-dependent epimerase/dehydratase family protein n=1 Tax=Haloarchaeobius sp. HRN-SO-5 TaxID=3446118 RepID=UPI003EB8DBF1